MSTTGRLLELLSLLQARRDWPGEALATRLGVNSRTVRRDVERLRDLGYRVATAKGPDGGYRLDRGSELPPLLFDADQAVALAVALRAAVQAGAGVEDAALRALTTVRQVLPSPLRARVDAVEFEVVPHAQAPVPVATIEAVSAAIRARTELRFDYDSPGADARDDTAAPRRAEPHELMTVGGRWYLVAWDQAANDWRIFRADRMDLRSHTGSRFEPRDLPGGAKAFVAARFTGSADGRFACRGRVVVDLPVTKVAPFVGEGDVEAIDATQCIVTGSSWSWVALAASFGRFDAPLTALDPPELVEAFATLAQRYRAAAPD